MGIICPAKLLEYLFLLQILKRNEEMIKLRFKPLNINNRIRFKSFLSSNEIRKRFIDYFVKENDHKYIKSSPVVPYNDPTIAFVNAGMCQVSILKFYKNTYR